MNQYKMICAHGHPRANKIGFVAEHIIVAEKMIGRHITKDEVVHHIDGDKKNNSPENLMVFSTKAEHTLFHHGGIAHKNGDVWNCKSLNMKAFCAHCGKLFVLQKGRKIRKNMYCSKECTYAAREKIDASVDEILSELKECNGNFSAVGRKHNVSSNAIVKMCKVNNLPYHSKDYKNNSDSSCSNESE